MDEVFGPKNVEAARSALAQGLATDASHAIGDHMSLATACYVLGEFAAVGPQLRAAADVWSTVSRNPDAYKTAFGALSLENPWNEACWVLDGLAITIVPVAAIFRPEATSGVLRALRDRGDLSKLRQSAAYATLNLYLGSAWASGPSRAAAFVDATLDTWEIDGDFFDYGELYGDSDPWLLAWSSLHRNDVEGFGHHLGALAKRRQDMIARDSGMLNAHTLLGLDLVWLLCAAERMGVSAGGVASDMLSFWRSWSIC
ncbi:MAG: hypothetical protein R3B40_03210 [Polyangiales bacterium]